MKHALLRLVMRRLAGRLSAVERPRSPANIALWQFGGVGDMLLATPVIRALERAYPQAAVHLWCSDPKFAAWLTRFANVASINPFRVYDYDVRTLLQRDVRRELSGILEQMRAQRVGMVVNLHRPALLDWWAVEWWLMRRLAGCFTIGFAPDFLADGQPLHAALLLSEWGDDHYTRLYQRLLARAGIPCGVETCFPLLEADRQAARQLLDSRLIAADGRLVCLHVGGRRLKLEQKMWPLARFAEVARRLLDRRMTPLLIGVEHERAMGEELCARVPGCLNLIGQTTLVQMAALIARADGLIGHDSGPFHLAVAVDTPCVAICGRPDAEPEYLNYRKEGVAVVVGDHPDRIAVDEVWRAAMQAFGEDG